MNPPQAKNAVADAAAQAAALQAANPEAIAMEVMLGNLKAQRDEAQDRLIKMSGNAAALDVRLQQAQGKITGLEQEVARVKLIASQALDQLYSTFPDMAVVGELAKALEYTIKPEPAQVHIPAGPDGAVVVEEELVGAGTGS
jgi:predicted  nucleic acid-binding Zn-ribbon protein